MCVVYCYVVGVPVVVSCWYVVYCRIVCVCVSCTEEMHFCATLEDDNVRCVVLWCVCGVCL